MRPLLVCLLLAAHAFAAPKNIRVTVRLIEVEPADLTRLMDRHPGSSADLFAATLDLISQGKAKSIDTVSQTVSNAQKATAESILERIYPTEYEPPELGSPPQPVPAVSSQITPLNVPAAWDTRNMGSSFEIEPSFDRDAGLINIRFVPEWVDETEPTVWRERSFRWGKFVERMPTFTTLRTICTVSLVPGKPMLVGVLTPQPEPKPPALPRKLLLFIRADAAG
ncbi:MAG: hypothetical protein J0M04_17395 [Verrucomicrobia bacterium]|nr:hypothetical protein [Verrucomicrobiota bacterium]